VLGRTTIGQHNIFWPQSTIGADPQDRVRGYKTYAGYVQSTGTAALPTGWSINKTGTGVYEITHNLNFSTVSERSMNVTLSNAVGEVIGSVASGNTITVSTFTVGTATPADKAFSFVLFDLR
jgi:hypothetical protein